MQEAGSAAGNSANPSFNILVPPLHVTDHNTNWPHHNQRRINTTGHAIGVGNVAREHSGSTLWNVRLRGKQTSKYCLVAELEWCGNKITSFTRYCDLIFIIGFQISGSIIYLTGKQRQENCVKMTVSNEDLQTSGGKGTYLIFTIWKKKKSLDIVTNTEGSTWTPAICELHGAFYFIINHLTPNGNYMGRTAQLTSRCSILYIYSTNIRTEYFKHAA